MKEIGGYFSLELPANVDNMPNKNGILLNSCRNALELILRNIDTIKMLYIPYYTCNVVLEPIKKLNINYSFYSINENLEIAQEINLQNNEYIIYTNYFGIKDRYIKYLNNKYKDNLIIDNAQALFAEPTKKCAYSPRKYVGIADGGIAFIDREIDLSSYEQDISYERFNHLLIRRDTNASNGFAEFRTNDNKLVNNSIKTISKLTKDIIDSIDFISVKEKRINNFMFLNNKLKHINRLTIDDINNFECPLVYPFFTDDQNLKSKLIENKIYVATYWPNVFEWCKKDDFEYYLTNQLIALPIDQRYGINEMKKILEIIDL
ncbi:MAG: hypothetical protein IKV14_02380 [Muribaculaceae bacterium]|nr:hypothetical protein [Muribaculaceae bacterium]